MTNASAMTALATLNSISKSMDATQNQISTGYRVATASDNAAYWSIATTMRSDNSAMSTISDALGLGAATIDVQYTALTNTVNSLTKIKDDLVAATQGGVDKAKLQDDITAQQAYLRSVAKGATFNGENWLSVDSTSAAYGKTKTTAAGFTRSATGAITITTVNIDISNVSLMDNKPVSATAGPTGAGKGILDKSYTPSVAGGKAASIVSTDADAAADAATIAAFVPSATATAPTLKGTGINIAFLTNSAADQAVLNGYIEVADKALAAVTKAASQVGAVKTQIDSTKTFVSTLMDSVDRGIGQLVDADMDKASTKLKALQVQQQLGIQALSIANGNSQNILSLFRS